MAYGTSNRVGGTNDVELDGVVEQTSLFGKVLQSFAGVVIEVVFVELVVDDGGGQVELLVCIEKVLEDVPRLVVAGARLRVVDQMFQAVKLVVDGGDTCCIFVGLCSGKVLDGVAFAIKPVNLAVKSLDGVAAAESEELVVYVLTMRLVGIRIVFLDALQQIEFAGNVERGNDVENGAFVVVGRPVPSGLGTEELQGGVHGETARNGIFSTDAERVGQLEVAAEITHVIADFRVGVDLFSEEHGCAKADGSEDVQPVAAATLVSAEEVGPVEGDETHKRKGVGVERLILIVPVGIDGDSRVIDERLKRVARLAADIEET